MKNAIENGGKYLPVETRYHYPDVAVTTRNILEQYGLLRYVGTGLPIPSAYNDRMSEEQMIDLDCGLREAAFGFMNHLPYQLCESGAEDVSIVVLAALDKVTLQQVRISYNYYPIRLGATGPECVDTYGESDPFVQDPRTGEIVLSPSFVNGSFKDYLYPSLSIIDVSAQIISPPIHDRHTYNVNDAMFLKAQFLNWIKDEYPNYRLLPYHSTIMEIGKQITPSSFVRNPKQRWM